MGEVVPVQRMDGLKTPFFQDKRPILEVSLSHLQCFVYSPSIWLGLLLLALLSSLYTTKGYLSNI